MEVGTAEVVLRKKNDSKNSFSRWKAKRNKNDL